jgi:hypothetical protein
MSMKNDVERARAAKAVLVGLELPSLPANVSARSFRVEDVPPNLRHLVPLANIYGIGDDIGWDAVVKASTIRTRKIVARLVGECDHDLDRWLTSPAELADPSDAYLAFTDLRLAADLASVVRDTR